MSQKNKLDCYNGVYEIIYRLKWLIVEIQSREDALELIIKAVKNGDIDRFREIVEAYQQEIYRYIYKMIKNHGEAEELTQEVFVSAYTKLYQYKTNISFRAWLYRIAKNLTLNYLKRQSKLVEIKSRMPKEAMITEDKPHENDFDERVEFAMNQLNDKERNLLILKAVEEMSYQSLAEIYNRSESTLRKQYERAKVKFRKYYESQGGNY